jgi:hypothetical protein
MLDVSGAQLTVHPGIRLDYSTSTRDLCRSDPASSFPGRAVRGGCWVWNGAQQRRLWSAPLRGRPAPCPAGVLGIVRRDDSSQPPDSVPQGARMHWEGLLQPGASPATGADRQHGARILQARPSSERGQRGCREPQRSRIQEVPYLPARGMEELAEAKDI